MAKKGSTLTLRLNAEENKKLNALKIFLRERAGTKAILKAIEEVPEMAKQIVELESSLQKSEKELHDHKWKTSQAKKAIRDFLDFSKDSKK